MDGMTLPGSQKRGFRRNAKVESVLEKMLSDPHRENIMRRFGYHHYHYYHHKSWPKLQAADAFPPVLFHEWSITCVMVKR